MTLGTSRAWAALQWFDGPSRAVTPSWADYLLHSASGTVPFRGTHDGFVCSLRNGAGSTVESADGADGVWGTVGGWVVYGVVFTCVGVISTVSSGTDLGNLQ